MTQNITFPIRICFVCHGNICRSPFAAAFAQKLAHKSGWDNKVEIDSAGTSKEHVGELPHPSSIALGRGKNLNMNHLSRQFTNEEFELWDYIIVMDRNNERNLKKLPDYTKHKDKVSLLRNWDDYATSEYVSDPWGHSERAYDEMGEIICSAMIELFDQLKIKYNNFKS
jgi:protein-tyrosine phosphatase